MSNADNDKIISCMAYRAIGNRFLIEAEIAAPQNEISINDFKCEPYRLFDLTFLNKEGDTVIGNSKNVPNSEENYARVAFIAKCPDEITAFAIKLSSIYGECTIDKSERYPDRLYKIFDFEAKSNTEEFTAMLEDTKSGMCDAMANVAISYDREADYEKALEWALKCNRKYPDTLTAAFIGKLYNNLGDTRKSEEYLKAGMKKGSGACYRLAAKRAAENLDDESCLKHLIKALTMFVNEHNPKNVKNADKTICYGGKYCDYRDEKETLKNLIPIIEPMNASISDSDLVELERALITLSQYDVAFAQYLLANLYYNYYFGGGREKDAETLFLKCLMSPFGGKEYDIDNEPRELTLSLRRNAIERLLETAGENTPEYLSFKSELVFIPEYQDPFLGLDILSEKKSTDFHYWAYITSLSKFYSGKKDPFGRFAAYLITIISDQLIENPVNYSIIWDMRRKVSGDDNADLYEFQFKEKDFNKRFHIFFLSELKELADLGDSEAQAILALKSKYPFAFEGFEKRRKSKIGKKTSGNVAASLKGKGSDADAFRTNNHSNTIATTESSAKSSDIDKNYGINISAADRLETGIAEFKSSDSDSGYNAARECFEYVIANSSDSKKVKTAYKYLIKIYSKGLGVPRDKSKAHSLKNRMKTVK